MWWGLLLWACVADPDMDGDGSPASEDCDDSDPSVYPGAPETFYDGVDDNCNGLDDDDADGDHYPSDAYGGADCDDADPDISPAADEVCGDGIDNDCDDSPNQCTAPGAPLGATEVTLSGTYLQDRAGGALGAAGDFTGDGIADWVVAAPLVDTSLSNHGRVWLLAGPVAADDVAVATLDGGEAGEQLGTMVSLSDADGDGFDELVLASPEGTGEVYVISGSDLLGELSREDVASTWSPPRSADEAGSSLAAGDVDDDGAAELLVGAPRARVGSVEAGVVFVVSGGLSGGDLNDGARLTGAVTSDFTGSAVATGDVDGDGVGDVLVGARGRRTEEAFAGTVFVVLGPLDGDVDLVDEADAVWSSTGPSPQVGTAVVVLGDADGDGVDDWAAGGGTWGVGELGAAWVVTTTGSGERWMEEHATAELQGSTEGGQAGATLAGGGDVDGDGVPELLVGAPDAGEVYLVAGDVTGTGALDELAWGSWMGEADSELGAALGFVGDLDGDGLDELTLGAPGQAVEDVAGAGVAYLLYGDAGW